MSRRLFVSVPLALVVATCALYYNAGAQETPQPPNKQPSPKQETPGSTFTTGVTDVMVPVSATDLKGRFVSNLVKDDFKIYDEGREQKITYFSHDQSLPIVVGFLLDQSNGMKIHWAKYQEAATELMLQLLPVEKQYNGYLITYGNQPELVVDTTPDSEKMVEKLRKMKPGGGSALLDAVYMACTSRRTIRGEPYQPRRVIVIIGDGHDTTSKKTLKEVIEIAQRNLVTIYAMSTVAFGFHSEGEDYLTQLTEQTGGKVETPLNNLYKDVSGYLSNPSDDGNYALTVGTGGYTAEISSAIYRSIANLSGEITAQYVMRYTPDVAEKGSSRQFRRIRVVVNNPPGINLKYPQGYYPFAPPQ
jgi:VWFA-related protein